MDPGTAGGSSGYPMPKWVCVWVWTCLSGGGDRPRSAEYTDVEAAEEGRGDVVAVEAPGGGPAADDDEEERRLVWAGDGVLRRAAAAAAAAALGAGDGVLDLSEGLLAARS